MPTFRQDTKIGGMVPMMKTDDYNDQSVTEEKLKDGAITTRKIADGSVTKDKLDSSIRQEINDSVTASNEATEKAKEATVKADQATENAKQATAAATAAKEAADTATQLATNATTASAQTTEQAKAATTKAEESAAKANEAAQRADDSREQTEQTLGTMQGVISNITEEQTRVGVELEKKFDKSSIAQESGEAEDKAMSQKAVSDKLRDLDTKVDSQKDEVDAAKNEALQAIKENENSAITNFNSQRVTPDMLSQSVKDLINSAGGGTINNLADDEDIQSVYDGTGSNVLKFANRAYNPVNFSGKGYKILRKNIVNRKNVLTQEMLNESNTIYEIRYDFDLRGQEITIPESCVLKFKGGSLNNGIINGLIRIVGDYIGNINTIIKGENLTNDFIITKNSKEVVKSHIESARNGIIIEEDVQVGEECILQTSIKSNNKSKLYFDEYTRGILLNRTDNISIENIEIIKSIPVINNSAIRYRQNIYIEDCSNITINNCKLNGSVDTTSTDKVCKYIYITNNTFDCDFTNIDQNNTQNYIQKDVISIYGTNNVYILNNTIRAKNVNRVFKTSSTTPDYINITLLCRYIYIENNTIIVDCQYGKQLYDMYCGVTDVFFRKNYVRASGFNRIIENKLVDAKLDSNIHITDNYIECSNILSSNFYFAFNPSQKSYINFSKNTIITTNQLDSHSFEFRGVNVDFNNNIYKGDKLTNVFFSLSANQDINVSNNTLINFVFFISANLVANSVIFNNNSVYNTENTKAVVYLYREAVINNFNIINASYNATYLLSVEGSGECKSSASILLSEFKNNAILLGDNDGDLVDKISCVGGIIFREGKGYKVSDYTITSYPARILYKAKVNTIAKVPDGRLLIYDGKKWKEFSKTIETATKGTEDNKPVLTPKDEGYFYWNKTTNCLNIWNGYRWVGTDGYNPIHYEDGKFPTGNIPTGFQCYRSDLNALCIFIKGDWYKIPISCEYNKNNYGAFSEKPTKEEINNSIGFAYFCTDRKFAENSEYGMVIYHKGNDVWVDAAGVVVN